MALFLRPNGDFMNLGWDSTEPIATPKYTVINEVVLDEIHNIHATGSSGDAEIFFNVETPPAPPTTGITCFVRCYSNKAQNLGDDQTMEIRLYQGIPSPVLKASASVIVDTIDTLYTLSFSSSLVTNWAQVLVSFYRAPTTFLNRLHVYQAWLEVPGFPHLDVNGPGLLAASEASGNSLEADGPGFKRKSGVEGVGALIGMTAGFTVKT